jgi:hypothetical protein
MPYAKAAYATPLIIEECKHKLAKYKLRPFSPLKNFQKRVLLSDD